MADFVGPRQASVSLVARDGMNTEKLRTLASDLTRVAHEVRMLHSNEFPVWAARLVDKCRADVLGQAGSYRFNCPMDRRLFEAAGLSGRILCR